MGECSLSITARHSTPSFPQNSSLSSLILVWRPHLSLGIRLADGQAPGGENGQQQLLVADVQRGRTTGLCARPPPQSWRLFCQAQLRCQHYITLMTRWDLPRWGEGTKWLVLGEQPLFSSLKRQRWQETASSQWLYSLRRESLEWIPAGAPWRACRQAASPSAMGSILPTDANHCRELSPWSHALWGGGLGLGTVINIWPVKLFDTVI